MRLRELIEASVATSDPSDLKTFFRIRIGQADATKDTFALPIDSLKRFGITSAEALQQWKDRNDSNPGHFIDAIDVERNQVILKTKNKSAQPAADQNKPQMPSVEKMASKGLPDNLKP